MKLEKKVIIEEAFALLNEVGISQFNMRALASRLSVSATALYWHFSDKDELIKSMCGQIYGKAQEALSGEVDWRLCLLAFGRALRVALGEHRDAARLCASANPVYSDPKLSAKIIAEPLVKAGLSLETALTYEATITAYVLGWSVYNQNQSMHAHLIQMMDFESSFEVGLCAMVEGFSPV